MKEQAISWNSYGDTNMQHFITLAEWYKITSYNKGANNIHAIQMVIQTTNDIHILQHCLLLTPFSIAKLNKSVSSSSILNTLP